MKRNVFVKLDSDLVSHSPVLTLESGSKGYLTFKDKSGSPYLTVNFESKIHVNFFVTIQFIENESL